MDCVFASDPMYTGFEDLAEVAHDFPTQDDFDYAAVLNQMIKDRDHNQGLDASVEFAPHYLQFYEPARQPCHDYNSLPETASTASQVAHGPFQSAFEAGGVRVARAATPEDFLANLDPALFTAAPDCRIAASVPQAGEGFQDSFQSFHHLFTSASSWQSSSSATATFDPSFQIIQPTVAPLEVSGQNWAMGNAHYQHASFDSSHSHAYDGDIHVPTCDHDQVLSSPTFPPSLSSPTSSSLRSGTPSSPLVTPQCTPSLTRPLPSSKRGERAKPYARPTELVPLSRKIDASDFTPAELERIQSRAQHKQLKEAKIIQAENDGKHITVPAAQACEACTALGYHCMVPRLEDFGKDQIEHHLGFCAGCVSNRGECTFRKRPERRLEAYSAAYGGQPGFELFGSKKHGVMLSKARASEFTMANVNTCWRYGGYPIG